MLVQRTATNAIECEGRWNATSVIEGIGEMYYPNRLGKLMFFSQYGRKRRYQHVDEIVGYMIAVTAGESRTFSLNTSRGLVGGTYSVEREGDIRKSFGSLVKLKGVVDSVVGVEIDSNTKIEWINKLPVHSFFLSNKVFRFKKPSLFDFVYEDGKYNLSNDQYGILAVSDSMRQVVLDAKDQLGLLWREYVECDKSELTRDAIIFRDLLMRRVV